MGSLVCQIRDLWKTQPALHWVAVYGIPMFFFFAVKLVALPAVVEMYADRTERTVAVLARGMLLALLEDLVATTLLLVMLLFVDRGLTLVGRAAVVVYQRSINDEVRFCGQALRFFTMFAVTALFLAPFAADMLFVRAREMRFTMELVATYFREQAQTSSLDVSPRDTKLATETTVATVATALLFAVVFAFWVDLSSWFACWSPQFRTSLAFKALVKPEDDVVLLEAGDASERSELRASEAVVATDDTVAVEKPDPWPVSSSPRPRVQVTKRGVVLVGLAYAVLTAATRALIGGVGPAPGAIALNATLNELFRCAFGSPFQRSAVEEKLTSAKAYIDSATEAYELFKDDSLFRRTTGFKGPLAFDVDVDQNDLPNVLVIAVESFRFEDSLYLSGNTTAGALLKKHHLRLTPNFDRWAKRGVAFSNMWSSWQTSRSLESILFAQIPLDSVSMSGTTTGRADTKLVGLPQFFKQKGYETAFSTGCITSYDQWDKFLPTHGFDTVLNDGDFKRLAEAHLGVRPEDWLGGRDRGFAWGVHDDLAFEILDVLIATKIKKQKEHAARGGAKHPFFLTHYTISSHTPFDSYPSWFDDVALPDFAVLCEGQKKCSQIKRYAKLRFFADVALGRFLDKLQDRGLLEKMVVVIVGDHGQSPEQDQTQVYMRQTESTHVAAALIAQGRLGDHVGKIIDDATEQYDLLNTLADIVGVPEDGFLQTGVGRSLKREAPFGERLVWSNNPIKKMAAVRGHRRFVYDRISNAMELFDTVNDPREREDLLRTRSERELAEWRGIRSAGRKLNAYFTERWEGKCLAQIDCSTRTRRSKTP